MLEETRKAIEESIQKWDNIAHKDGIDECDANCALCQRFLYKVGTEKCPLADMDGPCVGSCCKEWTKWHLHMRVDHRMKDRRQEGCKECDTLSEAMYQKLKSLLEEEP